MSPGCLPEKEETTFSQLCSPMAQKIPNDFKSVLKSFDEFQEFVSEVRMLRGCINKRMRGVNAPFFKNLPTCQFEAFPAATNLQRVNF